MGQIYRDVEITDTNILASGIAKLDGKVIFVNGAVAGDIADIEITRNQKNYSIARLLKLKSPSAFRATPDCPAFEKGCGGCSLRHIDYRYQLEIKTKAVVSAARRASAELPPPEKILSPYPEIYRNKVVFHYDRGRFGYFSSASRQVIPLLASGCIAAYPIFSDIAFCVEQLLKTTPALAPTYLYMRSSRTADAVQLTLGFNCAPSVKLLEALIASAADEFPQIRSAYYGTGNTPEASDLIHIYGDKYLRDTIAGMNFDISPEAFWQVNPRGAELLVEAAAELLKPSENDYIADLCCGTGLFSIVLASQFPAVDFVGIELNKAAAQNASHNAELNGLSNVKYYHGDCVEIAKHTSRPITAAILDPPRNGAPRELLTNISKLSIPRLVYVACSPEALARDSKLLVVQGYKLGKSLSVDLFANTSHVETLLCFERDLDGKTEKNN